jgi:PRTRC genetic system protein C
MAIITKELKRKFTIQVGKDIITLEDPNINFSAQDVMEMYSNQYPQLLNGSIEQKGIVDENILYHFATVAGTKG